MKPLRLEIVAVLLGVITLVTHDAPAPAEESLSAQRQSQIRGRRIGRELIEDIVRVQLIQLEENGLNSLELFGQLEATRRCLDELVEVEMLAVVELLGRLPADAKEDRGGEDRRESFLAMRRKSRQILATLLAEKQNVLRRLRIAEIAARAARVVLHQRAVLSATESLPEEVPSRRESLALTAIEDQRDVKTLYENLIQTLVDAASFQGSVAVEAIGGLEQLQSAGIDGRLLDALEHLGETRYAEAARSQRAVIAGLLQLLERVQRARGLADGKRELVAEVIRGVAERQGELYRQTGRAELAMTPTDLLAEAQSDVHRQLSQLAEGVQQPAAARRSLEEAEKAALEAAAGLFENKPQDAMPQQEKVLRRLADAIEKIAEADRGPATGEARQPPSVADGIDRPAQPGAPPSQQAVGATPPTPPGGSAKGGSPNPAQSNPALGNPALGDPAQRGQPSAEKPPETGAESDTPLASDAVPVSADRLPGANPAGQFLVDEPWFVRLPGSVQRAIRVGSQQRAPRGYEERLEQYFKNLDK